MRRSYITSYAIELISGLDFTLSILSPVASVLRAAFVSVNLFSLLCDGTKPLTAASTGTITRFGGPILYLFVMGFILLSILIWTDSGSILPRRLRPGKRHGTKNDLEGTNDSNTLRSDVIEESKAAASSNDLLRVLGVSKKYGDQNVVDDVSLGVSKGTVFAMLGPNGAGKTTCFNIIRVFYFYFYTFLITILTLTYRR